ncbi:hypothetical protein KAJ61_04315 [Candidatus Parcubacteria bacterium]|nr:hypothetical protein [Candidatus Parcubacteria bacterium]
MNENCNNIENPLEMIDENKDKNSVEHVTSRYSSEFNPFKLSVAERQIIESDNRTLIPFEQFKKEILDLRTVIAKILKDESLMKNFLIPENYDPIFLLNELKAKGIDADDEVLRYLGESCGVSPFQIGDGKLIIENYENYYGSAASKNLFAVINVYANRYNQAKYLLGKAEQSKDLIAKHFPAVFVNYNFQIGIDEAKYDAEQASHFKDDDSAHILKIGVENGFDNVIDLDSKKTKGVFEGDYEYSRKTHDLITMIHEYSHGIFDELIGLKEQRPKNQAETAYRSIAEGFSVLMEFLFCSMKESEYPDDFSEKDLKDLKTWKKQRMHAFNHVYKKYKSNLSKTANIELSYRDGFAFMYKLYKSNDIEYVKNFIEKIDFKKAFKIKANSDEYKEALNDPNAMINLIGK